MKTDRTENRESQLTKKREMGLKDKETDLTMEFERMTLESLVVSETTKKGNSVKKIWNGITL